MSTAMLEDGRMHDRPDVTVGFLPLLDSALIVAAAEKGFASDENIDLKLVRETSWANIRDRIAVGHFQAAHMLAPMPIASNLGHSPLTSPLIAPMALGLGGNAITVSTPLYTAMLAEGMAADLDPAGAGAALAQVIAQRRAEGLPALRFAVVHCFSGHHYELRYWLSGCGIDPDRDIAITIVPPPLMADALAMDCIDGYCVGEPWNTVSVERDIGRIVTVRSKIWRNGSEKVLGVSCRWADGNRLTLEALLRALYRAAEWCGNRENIEELAGILAGQRYLAMEGQLLLPALTNTLSIAPGQSVAVDEFLVLHQKAATFPWQSHALWFYSQMVRWGHCSHSRNNAIIARESFRPDIYRQALKPIFAPIPGASLKVEGALSVPQHVGASNAGLLLGPDGFFDGRIFDPDHLDAYIAAQRSA
ncbi:MAG: CmpA/NrtA family ABC transporter substrate-binding protein [Allorhizobium sp.]